MKRILSVGLCFLLVVTLIACGKDGDFAKSGRRNFEKGNYKEAANDFTKAITKNPNRAEYYIDYGLTLVAQGEYEKALKQFDRISTKSGASVVKENSKRALRGKGIAYYQMHDYKKALDEFEKALKNRELSNLNVDILYYMASAQRMSGSYDKAVESYSKIIKKNKKDANAYSNRAYCYQLTGAYDKSLSDYNKALSLKPKKLEYYIGKYNLLKINNKETEAKAVLSEGAKIKPQTDLDQYNMARVLYYLGDQKAAMSQLMISAQSGIEEANYTIGEIYRENKNYKKALQYYEKYLSEGKVKDAKGYNQAAVCLMKNEEYDKALDYLKKGIEVKDGTTLQVLMKNEIITYENLGEYNKAHEVITDYQKMYPEDKEAAKEAEFIDTRIVYNN